MDRIERKVILVTGASSGLGQSTAAFLAARGHCVFGTSREPRVAAEVSWSMLPLDVCSDESVLTCVGEILAREGRLDALVNNAGHAFVGAIEETSLDEAKSQFETNFFGALRMMRAVLPEMRARNAGHIINVSSLAGVVSFPFLGAYGASKQALEAISESLDYELIGTGIRVTLMEPDGMRTSIGFHNPAMQQHPLAEKRMRLLQRLESSTREGGNEPNLFAYEVARAIENDAPPLRIVIGEMANEIINARRSLPEERFRALIAERALLSN